MRRPGRTRNATAQPAKVNRALAGSWISGSAIGMVLYLFFLMLPIYWLINMSLKTNTEISTTMTLWPREITFEQLRQDLHRSELVWRLHQFADLRADQHHPVDHARASRRLRVLALSLRGRQAPVLLAAPNRMAPPAVFALPFFNLYSAIGLFDTPWAVALAHCLFNVPLAVWILEGFMSGVPREIDETAAIDGYSFPRFFVKIFMPLIASGIGVAAFFCFMFSWVELLLARTLTSVNAKPIAATMTRTVSAAGMDWGLLAAAGVLTIVPGALVIWFVRNYIAKGFALGRV